MVLLDRRVDGDAWPEDPPPPPRLFTLSCVSNVSVKAVSLAAPRKVTSARSGLSVNRNKCVCSKVEIISCRIASAL